MKTFDIWLTNHLQLLFFPIAFEKDQRRIPKLMRLINKTGFLLRCGHLCGPSHRRNRDPCRHGKIVQVPQRSGCGHLHDLLLLRPDSQEGRDPGRVADIRGAVIALVIIFAFAPLAAFIIGSLPLDPAVRIGLFLVLVMPTTMSSGVVMTGAAGGNIAPALLITVVANSLSVVTIPFSLALLLQTVESVPIDKARMMIQMALLVLLPLVLGLFLNRRREPS